MSFLRNFDPASDGTREVADWIAPRIGEISGAFGEFVRKYRLQEVKTAVDRIVLSLAGGDIAFIDDIERDIRCGVVIRGSGVLVSIVDAYGRRCSNETNDQIGIDFQEPPKTVRRSWPFRSTWFRGDEEFGTWLDNSGIVSWARRQPEKSAAVDLALEIVISLAGDSRNIEGSMARHRRAYTRTDRSVVDRTDDREFLQSHRRAQNRSSGHGQGAACFLAKLFAANQEGLPTLRIQG